MGNQEGENEDATTLRGEIILLGPEGGIGRTSTGIAGDSGISGIIPKTKLEYADHHKTGSKKGGERHIKNIKSGPTRGVSACNLEEGGDQNHSQGRANSGTLKTRPGGGCREQAKSKKRKK